MVDIWRELKALCRASSTWAKDRPCAAIFSRSMSNATAGLLLLRLLLTSIKPGIWRIFPSNVWVHWYNSSRSVLWSVY